MFTKIPVIVIFNLMFFIACTSKSRKVSPKSVAKEEIEFKAGDIIFQSSESELSEAIKLATHSIYSHVGIVFNKNGQLVVYEAVQPVRITPLQEWIDRGIDGKYVLKRHKKADSLLSSIVLDSMQKVAESYIGKDYDGYFEWSDTKIYCSELVWKTYNKGAKISVGEVMQLKEFDLKSNLVRAQLKQRYGDNIPLAEPVVSPSAIYDCPELFVVAEN